METKIDKLKFVNDTVFADFMSNLEWAKETKMEETFLRCVDRLCEWADGEDGEVWIGHDFSSRSFSFSYARDGKQMLNGGMIFHGSHDNGGDGSAPTFSVNLSPHDGWRLHT